MIFKLHFVTNMPGSEHPLFRNQTVYFKYKKEIVETNHYLTITYIVWQDN